MCKRTGKYISKSLSDKYSQTILDHAKKCAIDAIKTSPKKVIQKTEEPTVELVGNKSASRITKV